MDILLVEDDELMLELLESIVLGLYPEVTILRASDFQTAFHQWQQSGPDLVICDWQLPGGTGLDLVRKIREAGSEVPFIMVTARSDRDSVLAAARYRVNGFIRKPFSVELVHRRLAEVMPAPSAEAAVASEQAPDFDLELQRAVLEGVQLSTTIDASELLTLMTQDELDVSALEKRWKQEPAVQTRLINAANSSAFRRSGDPVYNLSEALRVLGTRLSLDIVLAMALNRAGSLQTPLLKQRADELNSLSERVAKLAVLLARRAKVDEAGCYSAGMLHRVGELAVISVAQRCVNRGAQIDEHRLDRALKDCAGQLADEMRARWRLSIPMKQMIGATHALPEGGGHLRLSVMRAASLLGQGKLEQEECQRVLRRLDLSTEFAQSLLEQTG